MEPICLQGRTLTTENLAQVRALIAQHPPQHRTALSRHLCQLWNWRNGAGRIKDMAARSLLRKLHDRGLIELPPAQSRTARPCAVAPTLRPPELRPVHLPAIDGPLAGLQPIDLEPTHTPAARREIRHLLAAYHYRGFHGPVGENVQYIARDRHRRILAVMVFGAAAWKVAARDRFIGWSGQQCQQQLNAITNQQRFLILPWVRVPHLASHLLARVTDRLSADWQARYGHPVWLVETFVEVGRFAGTAYKAAGWLELGLTTGRTRQDRNHTLQSPRKTIWVRPLHPAFRQRLNIL